MVMTSLFATRKRRHGATEGGPSLCLSIPGPPPLSLLVPSPHPIARDPFCTIGRGGAHRRVRGVTAHDEVRVEPSCSGKGGSTRRSFKDLGKSACPWPQLEAPHPQHSKRLRGVVPLLESHPRPQEHRGRTARGWTPQVTNAASNRRLKPRCPLNLKKMGGGQTGGRRRRGLDGPSW